MQEYNMFFTNENCVFFSKINIHGPRTMVHIHHHGACFSVMGSLKEEVLASL